MIHALLGTKKNMTSTYDARGRRVGATVVEVTSNYINQIKTTETQDGYPAVQLGYGTKKSVNKPQIGHAKKAGLDQKIRWFREIRINNNLKMQNERGSSANEPTPREVTLEDLKPGQEIKLNQVFSIGDMVKVTATSKGKGFAGGVKRHGFAGGPKTHGQSDRHRAPGSIGSGTTPGRVYRGKKMAGHMGNETVSTLGLEIVGVDRLKNLLVIKGAVPGPVGGLVMVTRQGRIKGYTAPPEEKIDEDEEGEEKEPKNEGQEEKVEEVKSEENVKADEQSSVTDKGDENA